MTAGLSIEEHAALKARAEARGIATSTLATQALREFLAREVPTIAPDDYESSKLVYGDDGDE